MSLVNVLLSLPEPCLNRMAKSYILSQREKTDSKLESRSVGSKMEPTAAESFTWMIAKRIDTTGMKPIVAQLKVAQLQRLFLLLPEGISKSKAVLSKRFIEEVVSCGVKSWMRRCDEDRLLELLLVAGLQDDSLSLAKKRQKMSDFIIFSGLESFLSSLSDTDLLAIALDLKLSQRTVPPPSASKKELIGHIVDQFKTLKRERPSSPSSPSSQLKQKRPRPEEPQSSLPYKDKVFCFSGPLAKKRSEIVALILNAGGQVVKELSPGVHYLITADPHDETNPKIRQAKTNGTEVVGELFLNDLYDTTVSVISTTPS